MDNVKKVIEFAIEQEKEAAAFYRELQGYVSFNDQKAYLKELEQMEETHVKVLQNVLKGDETQLVKDPVKTLNISEYLVEISTAPDMSFLDILVLAMKREEKAQQMYATLAENAASEDMRVIFERLAREEAAHKLAFEKMYDDKIMNEN